MEFNSSTDILLDAKQLTVGDKFACTDILGEAA